VDGLAGAVALSVSSDGEAIYVAGEYEDAVALLVWSKRTNRFVFVDRIKEGERLLNTLRVNIDDTVPNIEANTPQGFFKVDLPLDLVEELRVTIPAGYPEAGTVVTLKREEWFEPGGSAYARLPVGGALKYPARLGGNMEAWSFNARDTEHWTLPDGSRYMAIASSSASMLPNAYGGVVVILTWDEEVKRFERVQQLAARDMAPSALSFFRVQHDISVRGADDKATSTLSRGPGALASYYLAVGNTMRHGDTRAPINVYRWDASNKAFVFHHAAPVKLVGNEPNDPLTRLPLPKQLSIEKLVAWELDGDVYVGAAVSRVSRQVLGLLALPVQQYKY
jgi:hypothetical protein